MTHLLKEALLMLPAIAATVNLLLFAVWKGAESWQATDWYISNEFGFVRRGLLGGLLRQISEQVSWLDINLFAFSITAMAVFAASVVTVSNSRDLPYLNRFAIMFSPAFYTFFILLETGGGGRKEALSILLILSYALSQRLKSCFGNLVGIVLLVIGLPVVTLIHESNFLFSAPILFFMLSIDFLLESSFESLYRFRRESIMALIRKFLLLVPGCIAFFFAYLYSSPELSVVQSICASWQAILSDLGCNPLPAALGALASQDGYLERINFVFRKPNIYAQIAYSLLYVFLIMNAFCCPIVQNFASGSSFLERSKIRFSVFFLAFIAFLSSLPLYIFAVDYGRWFSTTVTLVIIVCVVSRERIASAAILLPDGLFERRLALSPRLDPKLASLSIMFGSSIFTVPYCCVQFWQFTSIAKGAMKVLSGFW